MSSVVAQRRTASGAHGWTRVGRLHARTAWGPLLAWPIGMTALVVATARSILALYPTPADRIAYAAASTASPGAIAFNGRWGDLTTPGGITTNEVGFLGLVLFPVAGIILGVRLTRREEDCGRTELITAGRLGRLAPLVGAAAAGLASVALFDALTVVGLVAAGLPADGSARYALLQALFVLAWLGAGLLCAQVCRDARTATGLGLGVAFTAYLARAVVDGLARDLPWLTPMSWLPEAAPFGRGAWWPYAALVATALGSGACAVAVAHRRDLDGGLLAGRAGPARAPARLGTPVGHAWRGTRGLALAWLAGLVVWGGALGALTSDMTELVRSNPQLLTALGIERPEDVVTALAAALACLGAAALVVQGVGRLGDEETSGRLGLVLAARVRRGQVWTAWIAVIAAEAVVVLLVEACVFGSAAALVTDDAANLGASLRAAAVLVVPVLLVEAGALALLALAPRLTWVVWLVVGWAAVVSFLAQALDLPTWARRISPIEAVGRVPVEDPRGWVVLGCAVGAAVLAAVSTVGFGRRDLRHG